MICTFSVRGHTGSSAVWTVERAPLHEPQGMKLGCEGSASVGLDNTIL